MIIVKLTGGLGNQLFQYALGRMIASKNDTELRLDITGFRDDKLRSYELSPFNINAQIAATSDLARFGIVHNYGLFGKVVRRLTGDIRLLKTNNNIYKYVREEGLRFNPDIILLNDNCYLNGYWQSEKYFNDISDILRKELTLKDKSDHINELMAIEIADCNSVSLHIRRGDYVTNKTTTEYHGLCGLDYYYKAIDLIVQHVQTPHFYIFSDDMEWVRDNLRFDFEKTYVDQNSPVKGYEDLRLMSLCKYHIIANSSFSWWGAWLSNYENKIVYAPKKWFNAGLDTKDLIPDNWIRL